MDIRIGIANSPREINFETSQSAADVEKVIADDKGKIYIVPVASFSYIEVGSEVSRRVGFIA